MVISGDKDLGGLRVATGGYKWLWLVLGGLMWLRVDASGYRGFRSLDDLV